MAGRSLSGGGGGGGWRGECLLPPVQAVLEEHFGEALGEVRCHRGGFAGRLCRLLGAGAVTFGRRVYFSERSWRRYRVGDPSGVALAAHETAHVLQYRRDGLLRMLARYLGQYLRGRWRGLSHDQAYRAIDYEREAFAVEAEVRCAVAARQGPAAAEPAADATA